MSIRLGEIIHDFTDEPLDIKPFVMKLKYEDIYKQLFYKTASKTNNRLGFYVLELPITFKKEQNSYTNKHPIGYKFGKASSYAGLIGRLQSYYINYGDNVKILHLRIFNYENLNYIGARNRSSDYEKAVIAELKRNGVEPLRSSREFYTNLKDIRDAMNSIDANPKLIGPIFNYEYTGKILSTGTELILMMNENNKLVPYKLTLGKFNKKTNKWDVEFKTSDGKKYAFKFPLDLYGVADTSSGWILANDTTIGKQSPWKNAK